MHLYFCIVSHGHAELLAEALPHLAQQDFLRVCVVDNLGQPQLSELCAGLGFVYLAPEPKPLGFGANNNRGFAYWAEHGMGDEDYFVCCNPDVSIQPSMLAVLHEQLATLQPRLAAINLFSDAAMSRPDFSIRHFPRIGDYLAKRSEIGNPAVIDKRAIDKALLCDWAAGSFLLFRSDLYREIGGFDERYFMYFEDVDICLRARRKAHEQVLYLPQVTAVHKGAFKNRNVFSWHFYWYLSGMLKYFLRYYAGGGVVRSSSETQQ